MSYLESAKELYENKLVADVTKVADDKLLISFNESNNKLKLIADTGCICDVSWFEFFPETGYEYMIGRRITRIYVSKDVIELPLSGKQECDDNKIIIVEFSDGTEFKFILRNSSNGYYSGFLHIELVDADGNRI